MLLILTRYGAVMSPRKSPVRSAAFLQANRRHEQRSTGPRNVRGEAPQGLNAFLSGNIRKSNRKGEAYAQNTNTRRKCKLLKKSRLGAGQGEKKGGTPKVLGCPDKCMKNKATKFEMLGYPDILLKTNEINLFIRI